MAASLQLPADVESWPAQRVVEYVLGEFPGRAALACSFQKEESVLLDMLFELEPKAQVFAIDTNYLFPETYKLWQEVERRYDTKIQTFPTNTLAGIFHFQRREFFEAEQGSTEVPKVQF